MYGHDWYNSYPTKHSNKWFEYKSKTLYDLYQYTISNDVLDFGSNVKVISAQDFIDLHTYISDEMQANFDKMANDLTEHFNEKEKTTFPSTEEIKARFKQYLTETPKDVLQAKINEFEGIKESDGKLNYELDFEFIQAMAERMSKNKNKYPPYNWKKPIDVESLKQSLFRHTIEVMKGTYSEDGRDYAHFESIALNCMMIVYQLKHNGKNS